MSLKIRLARAGSKKRPYYHVVVADVRSPRDGRFIETVGAWNPMLAKDAERVKLAATRPRVSRARRLRSVWLWPSRLKKKLLPRLQKPLLLQLLRLKKLLQANNLSRSLRFEKAAEQSAAFLLCAGLHLSGKTCREVQFPCLADQIDTEGMVRCFIDKLESGALIKTPCRR